MGNAATITEKQSLFAFKVVSNDYSSIIHYNNRVNSGEIEGPYYYSDRSESLDRETVNRVDKVGNDQELCERLQQVWQEAIREELIDLELCRNPSVIVYKYSGLSNEEKEQFIDKMLALVVEQDKNNSNGKKNSKSDYSKSFGGTVDDTKNEKEAAEILRGNNDDSDSTTNPALLKPVLISNYDHRILKESGSWCKYLGSSDCYMYLHVLTRDIVSIRPEEYAEVDDNNGCNSSEEVVKDPANGLKRIDLVDLPVEVERIVTELKKTPLIIDCSPTQAVNTYYSYKAMLEVRL